MFFDVNNKYGFEVVNKSHMTPMYVRTRVYFIILRITVRRPQVHVTCLLATVGNPNAFLFYAKNETLV